MLPEAGVQGAQLWPLSSSTVWLNSRIRCESSFVLIWQTRWLERNSQVASDAAGDSNRLMTVTTAALLLQFRKLKAGRQPERQIKQVLAAAATYQVTSAECGRGFSTMYNIASIKLTSLHESLLDFFYYVSDRMNNFTTNVKLRMSEFRMSHIPQKQHSISTTFNGWPITVPWNVR